MVKRNFRQTHLYNTDKHYPIFEIEGTYYVRIKSGVFGKAKVSAEEIYEMEQDKYNCVYVLNPRIMRTTQFPVYHIRLEQRFNESGDLIEENLVPDFS